MPEGVEVRKFADILIHNLVGHSITDVNILKGRYTKKAFDGYKFMLEMLPLKVISIKCKGKMTYIEMRSEMCSEMCSEMQSGKAAEKTVWLINT